MEHNFLELVEIESIDSIGFINVVDIGVEDDASFILSNGIISHNSALSSIRQYRDPQTFGAFPLKGKFINVSEMTNSEVIKNDEAVQLMASLGLKFGEDLGDLRYGRVLLYVDSDFDGNSIAASLINFFDKYWPDLINNGHLFKVMTPLVVAKKGKETLLFYTDADFTAWEKKTNLKNWELEYKKGLASLEQIEYQAIINKPVLVKLVNDPDYRESLIGWLGPDPAVRKEKLLKRSV
jgi:DNA gyrase/topoisomerase IV subunit B